MRRSIAAALRALGPAAVPALEEAAAASADAGTRAFLVRVAEELRRPRDPAGRSVAGSEPGGAPTTENPPAPMPAAPGGGEVPAPPRATGPAATPSPAPAAGAPQPRKLGRALLDRLVADLELRDEQRPKMEEVLAAVEKRQFELLRDLRRGAVAADAIGPRIESLRSDTLATARGFLDPAQSDLFAERAERYFDALTQRAARGEPGPPAPKPQAPDGAGSTAPGTGDR